MNETLYRPHIPLVLWYVTLCVMNLATELSPRGVRGRLESKLQLQIFFKYILCTWSTFPWCLVDIQVVLLVRSLKTKMALQNKFENGNQGKPSQPGDYFQVPNVRLLVCVSLFASYSQIVCCPDVEISICAEDCSSGRRPCCAGCGVGFRRWSVPMYVCLTAMSICGILR